MSKKPMSHPECDKMKEKLDEWNAIARFIEWLQENRMCIAVWRDPEAPYENSYTGEMGTIKEMAPHILEHPYPYGQIPDDLLYKYFNVNPAELERERREILENFRKAQE